MDVKNPQKLSRRRRHKISSSRPTADIDLPHDILLLILMRLPVSSLLRFRCVSKPWNLLISTQYFAKMHLNHSRIYSKPLGLIWKAESIAKEHISRTHIFEVDCSKLDNSSADTIHRLHHPLELRAFDESTLIGSCNGLLCLTWVHYHSSGYEDSFLVFNPLTRKCSNFSGETSCFNDDVDVDDDDDDDDDDDGFDGPGSHYYGFGYDDAHDDYKVVTWHIRSKQFENDPYCSTFDVYSVKKGSWSTTVSELKVSYKYGISCGVLVNCVLHWIWKNSDHRYNIVTFDIRTEIRKLIEMPENDLAIPDYVYGCRMELGELNGCLCGIVFHHKVPKKLDLWIMKEYPVKNSWTKMTIDLPFHQQIYGGLYNQLGKVTPILPIVHLEDKKEVILYSYRQGFLVCDMVTNKLSQVIKLSEFNPKSHEGVLKRRPLIVPKEFCFQGSLVQPPGFNSFHSLWDEQLVAKKIRKQKKENIRQRKRRRMRW